MQGINNLRPSLPRYDSIWDVQIVLSYIENMTDLTLLDLSAKFCMLFLLVTAQRCQTLHLVELDDIVFKGDCCVIKTNHVLKQSRRGFHLEDIKLKPYINEKLCVVRTLREYLRRTEGFRVTGKKLLISTQKPHHGVSQATVSRWVKSLMLKVGIKKQFGVHSTRAAATSAAMMKGVPLASILNGLMQEHLKNFTIRNCLRPRDSRLFSRPFWVKYLGQMKGREFKSVTVYSNAL